MRFLKLTFLASQSFLLSAFPQNESIRFDHISIEHGLSQSTVFSIAQDSTGFMWFGTEDGLNRFDGYYCTVYRSNPLDSNTISDIGIRKLHVDHFGNLWIITLSGKLDRYDPVHDVFIHYKFESINQTTPANIRIVSITEDKNGKLWVGSNRGLLFICNRDKDNFDEFHLDVINKLPEEIHLQCLYVDKSTTMWLGTWEGLVSLNLNSGEVIHYKESSIKNSISGNLIFNITEDNSGKIWVASANGGVSVFSKKNNLFKSYRYSSNSKSGISSDRVISIYADSYSNIWIGTLDRGVDLFRPDDNMSTNYRHNPDYKLSIGNGAIFSIFEDRNESIWFGTSSGGVSKYDRKRQNFSQISHDVTNPSSLSSNVVLSICKDRTGALWIGTDGGGLNLRLPGKREFKHFFSGAEYSSNSITTVYEDRSGKIWIGTDPGGKSSSGFVFNFDRNNNSFIRSDKINLALGGVAAFYEDSYGDLWVGTSADGVRRYIKSKKLLIEYKHNQSDSTSLSGNSAFKIFEDSHGNLWIGTIQRGLNKFIRENETFKRFVSNPGDSGSLSNNTVWSIAEDDNGSLWLGTWGGGLNKYIRQTESFKHFTVKDGLQGNVIYAILPDNENNLWISSSRGISRFNTETFEIKNYDESDGLQNLEFNQGAFAKGKDGTLYFGGTNGVTFFNPAAIIENEFAPQIVFTDFRVFDKKYPLEKSLNYVNKITLSYQQNFFSFEFAALDYTAPEKNEYIYMLEGVDKDWVKAGTRRFANYTDVAPGEYVFHVKGSNNDGVWSKKEAQIMITINPPFWQTWWFRFIAIAFLLGLFYAFHKYRLNKLLEVERTRIRIARDLHDDVSATITGMVYFSDAIDKEVGESKSPMLKKLITLIRESASNVQESMSDIIWSINPENDKWEIVLPKFRRYASDLCESKGINYKIDLPETVNIKPLDMERRRNLWLIYKEMVTNSVKHSQCTELTISISLKEDKLNLIVSDNGKGFDPAKMSAGNGVKNIYSRSSGLDGKLNLGTSKDNGTKWELIILV